MLSSLKEGDLRIQILHFKTDSFIPDNKNFKNEYSLSLLFYVCNDLFPPDQETQTAKWSITIFFLQDRIKFPFLTTVALTVPEQENTEAHQKFSSIKIQFHTWFHKVLLKCLEIFFTCVLMKHTPSLFNCKWQRAARFSLPVEWTLALFSPYLFALQVDAPPPQWVLKGHNNHSHNGTPLRYRYHPQPELRSVFYIPPLEQKCNYQPLEHILKLISLKKKR